MIQCCFWCSRNLTFGRAFRWWRLCAFYFHQSLGFGQRRRGLFFWFSRLWLSFFVDSFYFFDELVGDHFRRCMIVFRYFETWLLCHFGTLSFYSCFWLFVIFLLIVRAWHWVWVSTNTRCLLLRYRQLEASNVRVHVHLITFCLFARVAKESKNWNVKNGIPRGQIVGLSQCQIRFRDLNELDRARKGLLSGRPCSFVH